LTDIKLGTLAYLNEEMTLIDYEVIWSKVKLDEEKTAQYLENHLLYKLQIWCTDISLRSDCLRYCGQRSRIKLGIEIYSVLLKCQEQFASQTANLIRPKE
jgi:hypothetical protein